MTQTLTLDRLGAIIGEAQTVDHPADVSWHSAAEIVAVCEAAREALGQKVEKLREALTADVREARALAAKADHTTEDFQIAWEAGHASGLNDGAELALTRLNAQFPPPSQQEA